ncbi:MAG: tungsten ABC transporter substrate-binding protein, partial [Gemmatimonadales bacterium]
MRLRLRLNCITFGVLFLAAFPGRGVGQVPAGGRDVLLATTTSLRDTGLLDSLLPIFEHETGYRVRTIAVG